ncbi:MAG: hypothetical protein ABI261_03355 [Ginsengibacter sp.]
MKNSIYKYQINLKQQLILLTHVIFIFSAFIGFGIYLYWKNNLDNKAYISVFLFFLVIDILPTIIIHIQYWIKNHGIIFIINTETKKLQYEGLYKIIEFSFDDISSLQYYPSLGKGSGWHSFGEYRYYKIIFKDKTEIVITCLMVNDIEDTLEMLLHLKAERHSKVLSLIE